MLLTPTVLLSLLAAASGFQMYIPGVGSFKTGFPYSGGSGRPFAYIPDNTDVQFYLYEEHTFDVNPRRLCTDDPSSISSSSFDPKLETFFLIHCFTQDYREPVLVDVATALKRKGPCNVIMVDWSAGSMSPYLQAVQTARVVGIKVSVFIQFLQAHMDHSPEKVTLFGLSLGAQIAGMIGNQHGSIHRIFAMDPVSIGFETESPELGLNPSSANITVTFHTNGKKLSEMGFGQFTPNAKFDIYINGGQDMPECPKSVPGLSSEQCACILGAMVGPLGCPTPFPSPEQCKDLTNHLSFSRRGIQNFMRNVACSHLRAAYYFIKSMDEDLIAYPCDSLENCKAGVTTPCPPEGCQNCGYSASFEKMEPGKYYARMDSGPVVLQWDPNEVWGI